MKAVAELVLTIACVVLFFGSIFVCWLWGC